MKEQKKARIEIGTYGSNNKGTRINYDPGEINPYVTISVLQRIIKEIEMQLNKNEGQ